MPSFAELGEQSYQLTLAWVLPVWNVVRCIVRCVVSVGNVFRLGSSSERHHSKRTASRTPQQRLPFRTDKLQGNNCTWTTSPSGKKLNPTET
jgi:hypothetical protein